MAEKNNKTKHNNVDEKTSETWSKKKSLKRISEPASSVANDQLNSK